LRRTNDRQCLHFDGWHRINAPSKNRACGKKKRRPIAYAALARPNADTLHNRLTCLASLQTRTPLGIDHQAHGCTKRHQNAGTTTAAVTRRFRQGPAPPAAHKQRYSPALAMSHRKNLRMRFTAIACGPGRGNRSASAPPLCTSCPAALWSPTSHSHNWWWLLRRRHTCSCGASRQLGKARSQIPPSLHSRIRGQGCFFLGWPSTPSKSSEWFSSPTW
jgi:hypothetical protein